MRPDLTSSRGASLIEYGLILGFAGISAVALVQSVGYQVADTIGGVEDSLFSHVGQGRLDPNAFALQISGSEATIYPRTGGSIEVDWGNRAANSQCGRTFVAGSSASCSYDEPGTYRVSITGNMTSYGDAGGGDTNEAITRVLQWGNTGLTSLEAAFIGASNLVDVPANIPASVTSLSSAFFGASALNDADISLWNTGSVVDFSNVFEGASSFDVDVGAWDVSSGLYFYRMFREATSFNQDIGSWDMRNAQTTQGMFRGAFAFDRDLSAWDVSSVRTMQAMFMDKDYNHDVSGWDVGAVEVFAYMFSYNTTFDQDISSWDVSNATSLNSTFLNAPSFSHDISSWNTENVVDMERTFQGASSFTPDLSGWCVSNIPTQPENFSYGSGMTGEPVWGSCP